MRRERLLAAGRGCPCPPAGRARRRSPLAGSRPISASIAVVLPQPDSPTRPTRSAALERDVDAPDGVELAAGAELEPDVQVADARAAAAAHRAASGTSRTWNRRTDRWLDRSRGFSASSSERPIIVQARITNATATPGGTIAHQAPDGHGVALKAFAISLPQEIASGSPRPRKEIAVSAKIAAAHMSTAIAISSGATCGSTCVRRMRGEPDAERACALRRRRVRACSSPARGSRAPCRAQ